ncbi:glycosyltransferase family 39 protein [Comamonas sp. NLF-1-9]|uniref:ArnT family glycosyltransferase n=1 Tax=Comamonas sp. NLF-1-9 TaxID=2853163 RepID=UPI001C46026D|nr:glycosyltransferase family 39 protein [Comamonas sp. NLF-1-9]QXL85368.1 glycosyltransferase family 39 protein [Comamonas sp. NLF-1-9]
MKPTVPPEAPPPPWRWLALLLGLLLLLAALRPLSLPDEGRYAEISRWMLASGDWLTPRLDGLPFFHKPPLLHWLQAAVMGVLGVSAWAARLVPAAAAVLMVTGLYLAVRRVAGAALARRAALVLAASGVFLVGGQYVNHDMLVASFIASAIWCFALALLHGPRPHAVLARLGFACCALGLLTKGLIGVALPGLVLLVWVSWARLWPRVLRLPWVSGLLVFALLALPWFVLAGREHPGLWNYLFGAQQFGRYTGAVFNNQHGPWFYPAVLAVMLLPWSVFLPFSLKTRTGTALSATDNGANQLRLLCWIWVAVVVLFFSLPRSKLAGYVLPVTPALALLAALGWQRSMAARRHGERWFALLALLPALAALALTLGPGRDARRLSIDVAPALAARLQPGEPVYVCGGYPYDLPFLARLGAPLIVVQDWSRLRASAGDNWQRELFEAGDFEPQAARRILQTPAQFAARERSQRAWLLAPTGQAPPPGWRSEREGLRWTLYASAPEGPVAPEHEGLACGDQHGGNQGQP